MGKIIEFSISLDTDRQVFYSGEYVNGYLRLVLKNPLKLRGLTIEFKGKGYCHWSESHGSGENRRTVSYTGREEIFRCTSLLAGNLSSASSSETIEMPADTHTFPFSFQLPPNLPTSFESSTGHIRYSLVGCIDKPWKFNHDTRKIITVNEVIDTNLAQFVGSEGGIAEKEVGCLCCLAGPVSTEAHVDRKAYCPGEMIYITAHCDNRSSRNITAMKAKLVKTVSYISSRKTRSRTDTVATLEGPPIAPRQFADWTNQALLVPATVPSISCCKVVQVHYHLVIHVNIPMAVDLKVAIPVTIGTVPFRHTYMNPAVPPSMPAPEILMSSAPPPPAGAFGYPDMPPPSYAAAVNPDGTTTEDEVSKKMHNDAPYAPMYTYAYPYQPR